LAQNQKHKRKIDGPLEIYQLQEMFVDMKDVVKHMPYKQQHILREWFGVWEQYISFENTFDPKKLVYYKRGDIVLADFGYNVGSELGGKHYAIVIENDNSKANNTVVVIPISSIDPNRTKPLHKSEVYLGKIIPNSPVESYAMPLQIRPISKLRIIKPKTKNDKSLKIKKELLDDIDKKIIELFTKKI